MHIDPNPLDAHALGVVNGEGGDEHGIDDREMELLRYERGAVAAWNRRRM